MVENGGLLAYLLGLLSGFALHLILFKAYNLTIVPKPPEPESYRPELQSFNVEDFIQDPEADEKLKAEAQTIQEQYEQMIQTVLNSGAIRGTRTVHQVQDPLAELFGGDD